MRNMCYFVVLESSSWNPTSESKLAYIPSSLRVAAGLAGGFESDLGGCLQLGEVLLKLGPLHIIIITKATIMYYV